MTQNYDAKFVKFDRLTVVVVLTNVDRCGNHLELRLPQILRNCICTY